MKPQKRIGKINSKGELEITMREEPVTDKPRKLMEGTAPKPTVGKDCALR